MKKRRQVKKSLTSSSPLDVRIRQAYGHTRSYHAMLMLVWPPEQFPTAHRHQVNGGPPACAMPFGKALRRMGGHRSSERGGATVWLPPEKL